MGSWKYSLLAAESSIPSHVIRLCGFCYFCVPGPVRARPAGRSEARLFLGPSFKREARRHLLPLVKCGKPIALPSADDDERCFMLAETCKRPLHVSVTKRRACCAEILQGVGGIYLALPSTF